MTDHKEAVQDAKGERRHREEVHRGNGFAMIPQKCQPLLGPIWRSRHAPKPS
jgi:hypothetical protein